MMGGAPVYKGLMRTVTSATPEKRFGFATCCMPPRPSQLPLYHDCVKQLANRFVGDVCLTGRVCCRPVSRALVIYGSTEAEPIAMVFAAEKLRAEATGLEGMCVGLPVFPGSVKIVRPLRDVGMEREPPSLPPSPSLPPPTSLPPPLPPSQLPLLSRWTLRRSWRWGVVRWGRSSCLAGTSTLTRCPAPSSHWNQFFSEYTRHT